MTIAAGFCTDHGLICCADSQYTGAAKVNQQKLFGYTFSAGSKDASALVFALGGNEIYGKMAIEDCADAIGSCKPDELSLKKARLLLREAVKAVHEQYVDTRPDPYEKEQARFELVIGCWLPRGGGLKLFRTSGPGIISGEDYCCIGSGAYLGDYMMRNVFSRSMSLREVALLAIHAIASAKIHDATCGGDTHIMVIHSDGDLGPLVEYHDVQSVERHIADFERLTRRLLFQLGDFTVPTRGLLEAFSDPRMDKPFEENITDFVSELRKIRAVWGDEGSRFAMELIRQFRTEAQRSPE